MEELGHTMVGGRQQQSWELREGNLTVVAPKTHKKLGANSKIYLKASLTFGWTDPLKLPAFQII